MTKMKVIKNGLWGAEEVDFSKIGITIPHPITYTYSNGSGFIHDTATDTITPMVFDAGSGILGIDPPTTEQVETTLTTTAGTIETTITNIDVNNLPPGMDIVDYLDSISE